MLENFSRSGRERKKLMFRVQEDFEAKLKQAGDQLVVLDFFAEWCGPCKEIAPKFEEFAIKYTHVIFYKVGVDDAGDVAEKCNIVSMPTFVFFKNGQQVGKIIGGSIS